MDGFNLSQSQVQAWTEYDRGEMCGHIFREKYIKRSIKDEPSESQQLGHYFEYLATGALPAYGNDVPDPDLYKSGAKKGLPKPLWKTAQDQAQLFKEYINLMGWRVVDKGVYLSKPPLDGNLDVIVQVDRYRWDEWTASYNSEDPDVYYKYHAKPIDTPKYEECCYNGIPGCIVVDLKFTALINDKWNKYGWDLNSIAFKEHLKIQSRQYHYLSDGLPFFFWAFSSKSLENRLIRVKFYEELLKKHVKKMEIAVKQIKNAMRTAFLPRPSIANCCECPLAETCKDRAQVPMVMGVEY